MAAWNAKTPAQEEIPFVVARIVLQDFTGVPLLVDLAAMRTAVATFEEGSQDNRAAGAGGSCGRSLGTGGLFRFARCVAPGRRGVARRASLHADHVTVWRWVQRHAQNGTMFALATETTVGEWTRPTSGRRRIKARVGAMLGFKRFLNARRVLAGIEQVQKIIKGQFGLPKSFGTDPLHVWYNVLATRDLPICNRSLLARSTRDPRQL